MCAVEGLDIVPEDLLDIHRVKHRKGGCFDFLTKYLSVNTSVEHAALRSTFDIATYSLEKKWATHVLDVSGNFHYEDSFQILLSDEELYDL